MTARERFNATMTYGQRDRVPVIDLGFWTECFLESLRKCVC